MSALFPLAFHNRTQHKLPLELCDTQQQVNNIVEYATTNEMEVNFIKTKLMLFNTAKKRDFMPTVKVNNQYIDLVEQFKLIGVIITSDLNWNANTEAITKKGYARIWYLRRLKSANLFHLLVGGSYH